MKNLVIALWLLAPSILTGQEKNGTFKSAPHEFALSYPVHWQSLPKLGGRMAVHVGGSIGKQSASMSVIVSEDESFRIMTIVDYLKTVKAKDFLDVASISMTDVKMHRWEPKYELGGQPALMFVYSGILDGARQCTLTIQTIKNGRLYTLGFNAPSDDFPVMYLELKKIADSFAFQK